MWRKLSFCASGSWAMRSPPRRDGGLVVASDLLVAVRDRHDLVAADDVLDVLERLVAGALPDFAQDGVRRVLAVRQHHLRRRGAPLGLVSGERLLRVALGHEGVR